MGGFESGIVCSLASFWRWLEGLCWKAVVENEIETEGDVRLFVIGLECCSGFFLMAEIFVPEGWDNLRKGFRGEVVKCNGGY